MTRTYRHTMYACYVGYFVQAIVNNFAPLLFLTFENQYGISMERITFLVTFNFALQLVIDMLAAGFIDRIGYRAAAVLAHIFSAVGLISLAILPEVFPTPFSGLLTAVCIYAVGGGLIEVLITPLASACPSDNQAGSISLLHSFYCWGHMAVVLISTLFFLCFGTARWQILAPIWAVVPALNALFFARVPIPKIVPEGVTGMTVPQLLKSRLFWLLALLMLCAGASEQAVSQWASTFAEQGLRVSKTIGDLAGPMFFAFTMGICRFLYSRLSDKLHLHRAIWLCALLCTGSYLMISLSPWPLLSLIGCGICGFAVGIFWPGVSSLAAQILPAGGTAMYALLALGGDLGCSTGPTLVGVSANRLNGDLHMGILCAILFPVVLLVGILRARKFTKS